MLKLSIRFSKFGIVAAGIFLFLVVATFVWIFFAASRNPADSGESGLLLLPFAMPWIMLMPNALVGPFTGMAMILFNALILYLVFGGVQIAKRHSKLLSRTRDKSCVR